MKSNEVNQDSKDESIERGAQQFNELFAFCFNGHHDLTNRDDFRKILMRFCAVAMLYGNDFMRGENVPNPIPKVRPRMIPGTLISLGKLARQPQLKTTEAALRKLQWMFMKRLQET